MRYLFELPPKEFELVHLPLDGRKLLLNQHEKSGTESGTLRTVQRARQRQEPLKRQPQRTCPADEAQPLNA